ncbi:MAG: MBL fold metallo-hydrolase [Chitinophagaceae bacterium]
MLLWFVILIACIFIAGYLFMQQPVFGKAPEGERLERIKKSPNYKDGAFQNLSHTPALTEGASYFAVLKEFIFGRKANGVPADSLPSVKTDLHALSPEKNTIVWFGHSSYFMQVDGKKILVDPVFSGNASPLSFTTKSFKGADIYSVGDLPEIDYLFISHDHYDHLDYKTILALKNKVKKVITGLGTGSHLEYWGYDPAMIVEEDWNTRITLDEGFEVTILPGRHFSGRGFKRNGTLWVSFALQTPTQRIFMGGDSGYDTHFSSIGKQFGPFDIAILECGQYDKSWKYIHMMPEEVAQAALDLKAKVLFPVHWSKFQLGNHAWDDPIVRVTTKGRQLGIPVVTPLIGEPLIPGNSIVENAWWKTLK